jgi:Ser/Thr protein kinase RdoA (MazF antagonist)
MFGIEGSIKPLTSERDQNFLVQGPKGGWVLKISNAHEDLAVTDFQTRAVNHALNRDPALPLPPFLESRSGQLVEVMETANGNHAVRMLAFVPGVPLKELTGQGAMPTATFARQLGELLARLALALKDFEHRAADHAILWDLSHFPALEPLIETIADPEEKTALGSCLAEYQNQLAAINRLPRQVIYNDLNDSNVLLDAQTRSAISGLIDFGDVVRAPRVFDLAVAASYRLSDEGGARQLLEGYGTLSPLTELELTLLPLLVRCRLATTLLITQWRAAQFPENRDYILRNYPASREALLSFDEAKLKP